MPSDSPSDFSQLGARSLSGEWVPFTEYAGKVVLVVNTASHCGFTPQYGGLEKLYSTYAPEGLVILGFPCNQFGNQEPGGAEEIAAVCQRNYGVSFPMFEKVEVNGPGQHAVFRWLTARLPGLLGRKVRWNFTKFLIGRDGKPVRRFAPSTAPEKLEERIVRLLRG